MRILKIIHGYPPNYNAGSEVYSQSVVNELKKKHKIIVFTREENPYQKDFEFRKQTKDNIDFVFVNMAREKDAYNHKILNNRFENLLIQNKPDIAHIGHLNHLSTGIIDVLNKNKIPIVYTLHDFWLMCPRGQFLQRNFDGKNIYRLCDYQQDNKCANSCYKMYFSDQTSEKYFTNWVKQRMKTTRSIIDKVDLFIAPSRYLMNRFIDNFKMPKNKIIYLDYGFPTHYLKPVLPQKKDIFTFGYIGTHIPSKGIDLLIKAFSKIKKSAKLKIFGREKGQSTVFLKRLAQKSINEVEFCGEYINRNLATTVFNKVDVIVVPSIWAENSPLVIHEAQACKIPVITANYAGMKEYVKHKKNGLLFEHRNKQSLYEQLNFAVENQNLVKKYGKRGYLYSKNGDVPSIEDHCVKLEKIYTEIVDNNE